MEQGSNEFLFGFMLKFTGQHQFFIIRPSLSCFCLECPYLPIQTAPTHIIFSLPRCCKFAVQIKAQNKLIRKEIFANLTIHIFCVGQCKRTIFNGLKVLQLNFILTSVNCFRLRYKKKSNIFQKRNKRSKSEFS